MANIFLDDYRRPEQFDSIPLYRERMWYKVKNYDEFVRMVERLTAKGVQIDVISFDHDLSDEHYEHLDQQPPEGFYKEKTGYDCIRWLEEQIFWEKVPAPNQMLCHSANPSGAARIR